ncbi:MAG: hypothetical protein KTR31_12610 [Myxococcales bacterium]|nr:hypothetical protein [Myxococcales bacterium]
MWLWVVASSALAGSQHGFVSVHPGSHIEDLHDVVATDDAVWAVGNAGTLLRIQRDGTVDAPLRPPVPTVAEVFDRMDPSSTPTAEIWPGTELMHTDLHGVGGSRDDLWIATRHGLAHYDGARWASWRGDVQQLHVEGSRAWAWPTDLLCSDAQRPRLAERQGDEIRQRTFVDHPSCETVRAQAVAAGRRWLLGDRGHLMSGPTEGPVERRPDLPTTQDGAALVLDPDGLGGWAITRREVFRLEGDAATLVAETGDAFADAALVGDELWLVGDRVWRLVDGALVEVPVAGAPPEVPSWRLSLADVRPFQAIDVRSPDDVWIVGAAGRIVHYDGTVLRDVVPRLTRAAIVGLVWEGEDGWVAASADGQWIEGTLQDGVIGRRPGPPLAEVHQFSALPSGEWVAHERCGEVWVRSTEGVWSHVEALPECVVAVGGPSSAELYAVVTERDLDVLGVAGKRRWRALKRVDRLELRSAHTAQDGSVWFSGDAGVVRAMDGGARVLLRAGDDYEYGSAFAASSERAWVAGSNFEIGAGGTLVQLDGARATVHEGIVTNRLYDVTVDAAGTVWAVGLGGVAVRSTPGGFEPVHTGTSHRLRRVYAHPSGAVVATGDAGAVLVRPADAPEPTPASLPLRERPEVWMGAGGRSLGPLHDAAGFVVGAGAGRTRVIEHTGPPIRQRFFTTATPDPAVPPTPPPSGRASTGSCTQAGLCQVTLRAGLIWPQLPVERAPGGWRIEVTEDVPLSAPLRVCAAGDALWLRPPTPEAEHWLAPLAVDLQEDRTFLPRRWVSVRADGDAAVPPPCTFDSGARTTVVGTQDPEDPPMGLFVLRPADAEAVSDADGLKAAFERATSLAKRHWVARPRYCEDPVRVALGVGGGAPGIPLLGDAVTDRRALAEVRAPSARAELLEAITQWNFRMYRRHEPEVCAASLDRMLAALAMAQKRKWVVLHFGY